MTDNVYWVLTLRIHDGKLDDFKALGAEMAAAVNEEPGTLAYEWHLSEDGSTVHTYERFSNAAAALVHLGGFGNFAERLLALCAPTGFTVYGKTTQALRDVAAGFSPTYMTQIAGFAR